MVYTYIISISFQKYRIRIYKVNCLFLAKNRSNKSYCRKKVDRRAVDLKTDREKLMRTKVVFYDIGWF